jgi:hypothetical protein
MMGKKLAEIALASVHPPRAYATCSHMHTTPSQRRRSSHSGVLLSASWQFSTCTKHRVYCKEPSIKYICFTGKIANGSRAGRRPMLCLRAATAAAKRHAHIFFLSTVSPLIGKKFAEIALASLHPPRPYATCSHMHTAPSPRPRSSRSHALRYFGFLSV